MQSSLVIIDSVLSASFSVLVICSVGALMYRAKHIDSNFTKQLSGLIERIFLPSLIITNFIRAVFIDQIWLVLPVILSAISVCVVGYMVGWVCNKYWIKDVQYEQIVLLACANPHTTNIQLQVAYGLQYLLADLTMHLNYPTKIDAGSRAITSIMIYTAVNNTLRWTLGKQILLKFAKQEQEAKQLRGVMLEDYHNPSSPTVFATSPFIHQTLTNSPQSLPLLRRIWNGASMPLIAITFAFVIVLIPPLQRILLDQSTTIHRAIYSPIYTLGKATTPSVLIMLGANIYSIMEKGGLREAGTISQRTLISITIARLIILPTVGFVIVFVMSISGFLQDPIDLFITFVTFATPSAVNIIVQAKQYTQSEDVVSVILMYSYLAAICTLPLWTIFFFYFMFNYNV